MDLIKSTYTWPTAASARKRLPDVVKSEALHWGNQTREYHDVAEIHMDGQWRTLIWPLLERAPIDYSLTIDFAAGFGRNTRKLLESGAQHVTCVDVNQDCIAALKQRFSDDNRVRIVQNDGFSLKGLETGRFSFLYSYDAVVHFDLEIVAAYMPEFSRVLSVGSYAMIHHSNYDKNPGGNFYGGNPHCRNFMNAAIFKHLACRNGFVVKQQHLIPWEGSDLDCITLMQRVGSEDT